MLIRASYYVSEFALYNGSKLRPLFADEDEIAVKLPKELGGIYVYLSRVQVAQLIFLPVWPFFDGEKVSLTGFPDKERTYGDEEISTTSYSPYKGEFA